MCLRKHLEMQENTGTNPGVVKWINLNPLLSGICFLKPWVSSWELVATQLETTLNFQCGAWGLCANEDRAQHEEIWVRTKLTSRFTLNLISVSCTKGLFRAATQTCFFPCGRIPQESLQLSGIKPHGCKMKASRSLTEAVNTAHHIHVGLRSRLSHRAADGFVNTFTPVINWLPFLVPRL